MFVHDSTTESQPSRVVVVGGTGFIGAAAVARMRKLGWNAVPIGSRDVDLASEGAAERLAAFLQGDDTVVFASAKAPAKTNADVVRNVLMTANFCDAVDAVGIRHLVVLSSDAVYGEESGLVSEASPVAPTTLHGLMSLAREQMSLTARAQATCVVRATNVYGVGDPHNSYGANRFLRQALESGEVQIFGDGLAVRDHIRVEDVAEFIARCCMHVSQGVVNAVSGQSCSFAQLARAVAGTVPEEWSVVSVGVESNPTFRYYDPTVRIGAFPEFIPVAPLAGVREYALSARR